MKKLFQSDHVVTIAPSSILFTFFFLFGVYGLFYIRNVLILLLSAFILSVALNPLVKIFKNKLKIPALLSIVLAYLCMVLILFLSLGLLIPPLTKQIVQLINNFDIPFLQDKIQNFNFTLQELSAVISDIGSGVSVVFDVINMTFNGVFTLFTVMVMSFYIMMERSKLYQKAAWFTKKQKYLDMVKDFIDDIEEQLGGWVRAQVILMVSIFVITYISLTLISVPYALPLALLAGFLEIVPNLGPTLAMLPALFIAYVTFGPVMAGIVALLYLVIQQLENNILVPKVMQESANVSPLVSITSILIGLKVAGIVGALLAIPLYIIGRTVFSTFIQPRLVD